MAAILNFKIIDTNTYLQQHVLRRGMGHKNMNLAVKLNIGRWNLDKILGKMVKMTAILKKKMAAICRIWIFANMYKYVIWDLNNMPE